MPAIVSLIGQALVAGGTSGARPLLSLFVLAFATRLTIGEGVPADVAWLVHLYGLVPLGVLAYLEHEVRGDPDVEEIARWPLGVLGVGAAGMSARLLAVAESGARGRPPEDLESWGAMAGAAVAALAVQHARRRAFEAVGDVVSFERAARRVESGGIVGVLVLVWLLPVIAVGLVVVLTVLAVVGGVVMRKRREAEEAKNRRPCAGCRQPVRNEALRCRSCGAQLQPVAWLEP